jgi:hypothetical protein
LAAYSSAGGPIAAEALKLRKVISNAGTVSVLNEIAQTNATAAPKRERHFERITMFPFLS